MSDRKLVVDLVISADEFLKLYQGSAQSVFARSLDGRTVRFPARILQKFVTHDGIRGRFLIEFNQFNQFKTIERIA